MRLPQYDLDDPVPSRRERRQIVISLSGIVGTAGFVLFVVCLIMIGGML